MTKSLLKIDISNSKNEIKDDLIKIKFQNEDDVQINFTNFFFQSKYLLEKYKYSEAIDLLQSEIDEICTKSNISEITIKNFVQLIQDETINIPTEFYKDFYTLSEYFCFPKLINVLDNIRIDYLYNDLNFTIQILLDSERSTDQIEMKLTQKIENFLKERINECISNSKFKELPNSTIFRLFEGSKEKIDQNSLIDFIFDSIETRFIFFKFVELSKLLDDNIDKFIKFISEETEETRKMYLEYIPFDLSFIINLKNKYDHLLNEMNQTKHETKIKHDELNEELNQTQINYKRTKHELERTKEELNQKTEELNQTKINFEHRNEELNEKTVELSQTKYKLEQTNFEFEQTKEELNQTMVNFKQKNEDFNQAKEELEQCKKELKQVYDELNKTKNESKHTQSIIVGGYDKYNVLGEKSNNKDKNDTPIIDPPLKLSIDPSSLQSFSSYCRHTVLVMNDGSLKGIGYNEDGRISSTLHKTIINDFTDFCIKDNSGHELAAVSAVCFLRGTLYILTKSDGIGRHLVLCNREINSGDPVFLNIGDHHPVSLFGGKYHPTAIGSEGEVIFINCNSVKNSPNSPIMSFSLPDGEKALSIACCDDSVAVLSSNSRIFTSPIEEESGVLKFSPVSELSGQEIVYLSGIRNHFLAVSKEGRVFGCGSNGNGQLGLGEETKSVSSFTEIASLAEYEIRSAYAGYGYSLFETREGKILSCGNNQFGQLLLSSGAGNKVYLPIETTITNGSSFCIAGDGLSVVFIGNSPPLNTPNTRIHE